MLTKWAQSDPMLETQTQGVQHMCEYLVRKTHVRNESEGWFRPAEVGRPHDEGVVVTIDRSGDKLRKIWVRHALLGPERW